jgi:hypothetical protein
VTCGTHDQAELDSRVAGLDIEAEKSRQRSFLLLALSRLTFGLWRI